MRLFTATVLTGLLGAAAMIAGVHARNVAQRPYPPRHAARRAIAEEICRRQGPHCKPVRRPGAPRDFSGLACVCE